MAVPSAPDSELPSCCICFEDSGTPDFRFAELPCCGTHTDSTVRFCQLCMRTVCNQGALGVGKCPRCRKFLGVASETADPLTITFEVRDRTGQCRMCRQQKVIVANDQCDACLFGSRHVFRYECDGCHKFQRVPHPLYRYQDSPAAFSGATWACHAGCGTYTHWRIASADVPKIPRQDVPDSWSPDNEAWFEEIRAARSREREERSGGCTIT